MQSVIVSGVTGFIGNYLCEELIRKGYKVYGISRRGTKIENEMYVDVAFSEKIDILLESFNLEEDYAYFFHFAWEGVSSSLGFRQSYVTQINNIKISCDFVEFAARLNCKKFVFAGSIFEYENIQNRNIVFDVSDSTKNYGYAKFAAHQMCLTLSKEKNIEFNSCLLSNVFGENDDNNNGFIYSIIKAIKKNESFPLSQCDQLYDFIYIEDAVNAIITVAEKGVDLNEYYVGYGDIRPLMEYILIIRNLINKNYNLEIGKRVGKSTYFDFNQFNVSKIKNDLNFKFKYDIVSGLIKTIGGYLSER